MKYIQVGCRYFGHRSYINHLSIARYSMHFVNLRCFSATQSAEAKKSNNPSEVLKNAGGKSIQAFRADVESWKLPYSSGPLSREEYDQFFEDGFVLKKNLFTVEELTPVIKSIEELVEMLAQDLFKAGKIKDLCSNLGFYQRLTAIDKQYPGSAVLMHKQGVLPKAISDLWSSKRLLDIASQFLGPDLAAHPVWNLRTKIPRSEQATVPWHQDSAYLQPISWNVFQPTAWIPLLDANLVNGCMQFMRGGHKSGKIGLHTCCAGNTWYIEMDEQEMKRSLNVNTERDNVTCEVNMGSVLFLNNLIPHRSLENYSDNIRWSLDLRFQKPNLPNGFYGLKDSLLMRKSNDSNYERNINWNEWNAINRTEKQERNVVALGGNAAKEDRFDTSLSGPWMFQWPIIHHNRHAATLNPSSSTWHKS